MEIQSLLINFVNLVYKDNAKQASKILGKLITKPYHDLLKNVITKINFTKQKVKNLQRIRQRYSDKEQQIDRLNMKIASLKIKKAKQMQSNEQFIKKFSIVQYLDAGQYQQAVDLSNKYKFIKLEKIGKQLLEYRWFKQQAQNWELSLQNKQQKVQWTQNGKKMKTMFMNNKIYHRQFNKYLSQALNNLLSKQKDVLNLPSDYFKQSCRDSFTYVAVQLHTLRDFKIIDEEQNIKLVQKASERLNMILQKEKGEKFEQLFERLVRTLEALIPLPNFQQTLTLTRVRSQRNYPADNNEMVKLYGQIKKLIQMNKSLQEQLQLSASSRYKQSIIACFRNIIANYEGIVGSLKANKQILQSYMQQSSNTLIKLDRINQEIQMIIPSLQNLEISKKSSEKNLEIFNKNVGNLLDQYRKKVAQINRLSTSSSNQQPSQRSRHSLSNTEKFDKIEENQQNNEPQTIKTHFFSKSCEDFIQKLQKQINQLRQENSLLLKKNQDLKDAFEQQYKVKDIQKKNNQSLVSKIKVLEGFRNSIINSSIFNQDTNFLELQQKYGALSMFYDQLKRTLDEKQQQIKYSQQNKQDIIKRKQKVHSEEIKKWKQRYNNARQQVEYANHQLLKLNQILQERLFQQTNEHSPRQSTTKNCKIQLKYIEAASERQVSQSTQRLICERQNEQNIQNQNKQRLVQESAFNQKIKELENTILKLKQQAVQRQKQHIEAQSKSKNHFEEIYQQMNRQKSALQSKIKDLEIKSVTHNDENIKNLHLFALGSIFQQNDYQQRLFLIQNLVSCVGRIKKTRLLYRADHYNKVNFHKYIDKEKHIVVIFKTIYGKLIAGYSEQAFDISGTKKGYGLILSLWARKVFQIKEKKAISYDDYFVIFGNSELRIKSLEFKLFSNFGIANGYFDNRGEKVNSILGEDKEREVELSQYEFYALDLDI